MTEVIEVEAIPVDTDIEPSTLIDRAVAAAEKTVAKWGDSYSPRIPETLDEYRQVKRERAALRRDIASITDTRKSIFSELKAAIREGESRFAGFIDSGKALDAEYKRGIDDYERGVVSRNMADLNAYYSELAPFLVDLVPLASISNKWGKFDKWASATANIERMREQLEEHVAEIADNEVVIDKLGLSPEETRRLKEIYFQSLDLAAAQRQLQDEREQRERLKALEEKRESSKTSEDTSAEAAGDSETAEGRKSAQTDESCADEPQEAPQGLAEPNSIATSIADRAGVAPGEAVPPIAFMAYVTESQRAGLVAYCKQHDIHGSFRLTRGMPMKLVRRDAVIL